MTIAFILGTAFLGLAAFLVSEAATAPARERHGSIRRAANYGKHRRRQGPHDQESFGERVLDPLKLGLAKVVLKVNPKASVDSVSSRLMGAGLGRTVSPTTFLATKAAAAAGGGFAGFVGGGIVAGGAVGLVMAFSGAAIGFKIPDIVVSFAARSRRDKIRSELPDALDLLAVSVEAGLSFDGAIAKLTEHMKGPLIDEFGLVLGEMRIGESRRNALQKMVRRIETPEISAFVRAIIQADELGISLGRILRVQATDTRNKRQAAAEEKAMKAPIKMLFPTALFIFPSMFIVILGPALLALTEVF